MIIANNYMTYGAINAIRVAGLRIPEDIALAAFDALILRGHTIVIIEHNMDVIKCADHIIDLGPEGGQGGGGVVVCGTPQEVAACAASHTGRFLKEKLRE